MKFSVVALSLGAAVAGVFAPQTSSQLVHALVAVLTVAALVAAIQPAITRWDIARAHPFTDGDVVRAPNVIPVVVAEIVADITRQRRVLSPKSVGLLRTIAMGRLGDHERAQVSPMLQAIVDGTVDDDGIPSNALGTLITELESL